MKKLIGQIGKSISRNGIKKTFSILYVLFISFLISVNSYTVAYADTGSLLVQLESIGTGGTGSDFLASAGPIGVAVSLGLMAGGIDAKITEDSIESGLTPFDYTLGQFYEFIGISSYSEDGVKDAFTSGLSVAADGMIYLKNEVTEILRDFGNWIVSNTNENFNDSSVVVPTFSTAEISGINTLYTSGVELRHAEYGERFVEIWSFNHPVAIVRAGNYSSLAFAFFSEFPDTTVTLSGYVNDVYSGANTYNFIEKGEGEYYQYMNFSGTRYWDNASKSILDAIYVCSDSRQGIWNFINSWDGTLEGAAQPPAIEGDCFQGNPSDWSDYVGGLSLPEGYTGAIDAGLLGQLQGELDQTKDYVITLEDYIKALEDWINGEAEADIPVYNEDTALPDIVDIPSTPAVPEYEQVEDVDIPDNVPVLDPEKPADPEEVIKGNVITGLKDVFPFCIPFDIYNLLNKFTATPQAPRFQFDYTVPVVNTTLHYDFDFSGFNSVAAVLRTMELVAAIVGLALATRAIFIRS